MKLLAAVIIATSTMLTLSMAESTASYSTETSVTLHRDKNRYEVTGRVSRLIEQDGRLTEEVIAQPKVLSSPGSPASFYVGPARSDTNYPSEENVTVDVSWPKNGQGGFAICTITVKRGDKVVSKSKTQMQVGD